MNITTTRKTKLTGKWFSVEQTNGRGYMIIEIGETTETGDIAAKIIETNISKFQADAICLAYNTERGYNDGINIS